MSFPSVHANKIWKKLYKVLIPDNLTLSAGYIKTFGVHVTNNKSIDRSSIDNFTTVLIPISTILEYFVSGAVIQIPSREDMLTMHKDIEDYLREWKEHLKYSINTDTDKNKDLLISLEKLSKHIYEKASVKEVVYNTLPNINLGLVSRVKEIERNEKIQTMEKPKYEGISNLIKSNKPKTRYGID